MKIEKHYYKKEKEYTIARQKIEFALESFYRSASSLVFQLNKRHITRHMSILRCIDRRFETGEIFVKWDESDDEEWLLLIYIKNNSPDEGIVIEDKTNSEKNISHEFKNNEIFKASDTMVDALTTTNCKKRAKKKLTIFLINCKINYVFWYNFPCNYVFNLKYILAWITYVNNLDSRLGDSTWRWTYDYQVVGERDFSDLDDKNFVRLRRKKNKLVTIMYSIFLLCFVSFMSWLSKFLISFLISFYLFFVF